MGREASAVKLKKFVNLFVLYLHYGLAFRKNEKFCGTGKDVGLNDLRFIGWIECT